MLQKNKNLFKSKKGNDILIYDVKPESTEEWKFINHPFEEELPNNIKIAAQTIGLDITQDKMPSEMTSGYFNFQPDEVTYDYISVDLKTTNPESYYKLLYESSEKTLFQMRKIKRASEKVLEKMVEIEKQNQILESSGNKHTNSKLNRLS